MKIMTAQLGNEFDVGGAKLCTVNVIKEGLAEGFDTAFVYWEPSRKKHYLGLTSNRRNSAPLFKEADLYCTCALDYDCLPDETGLTISYEMFEAACTELGKPDVIKVIKR